MMKTVSIQDIGEDNNYRTRIKETIESIARTHPQDVAIISGENEEIQTNKYLLSLFSPGLAPLLFSFCCSSSSLILPDFSAYSINNIIGIINNGVSFSDYFSWEDRIEIIEAGKLLFVEDMILNEEEKTLELQQIEADFKRNAVAS